MNQSGGTRADGILIPSRLRVKQKTRRLKNISKFIKTMISTAFIKYNDSLDQ